MSDNILFHAGDLGDIIYALPILKAMKDGAGIRCGPRERMTRELMTPERYALLAPLFDVLPYIKSHAYAEEPQVGWADGNAWRMNHRQGRNLCECQLTTFQLHMSSAYSPWLSEGVEAKEVAPVVFAKSRRYHNEKFPWTDVVANYDRDAVFVGTTDEYERFRRNFCHDYVPPHYRTKNLLELTQVIKGSMLFVGNQSCPYAIAEGLKVQTIQETCPRAADCVFPRFNAQYVLGSDVILPNI